MKRLLLFLFVFITGNVYTQTCNVTLNGPTYVCPGETVTITATAVVTQPNQAFDFNNNSTPPGWSIAGGGTYGSPCINSPDNSAHYWASTAGNGVPNITTDDFDVCTGGTIDFQMVYAVQSGPAPCEGPDLSGEGVSLQYSIDGGLTWIDIVYYSPGGFTLPSNPGNGSGSWSGATPYTTWNDFSVPIPPGAITTNTRFRWYQALSSGTCCDNWGIDNVFINAGSCITANLGWDISQPGGGSVHGNSFTTTITNDTTIVVGVYDDFGNLICQSDPLQISVYNPTISAGADQTICDGESVILSGSGGSSYTWNHGVINGTPFYPTATQTYTLNGIDASNGCPASDQVQVIVNPKIPTSVNYPNLAYCEDAVNPSATVTPNIVGTYTITPSSIAINSSTGVINLASFSATNSETYTVTFTPTDVCYDVSITTVMVHPLPNVNAGSDVSICNGQSTTLTANGASTYVWDNSLGAGNTHTVSPNASTVYNVTGTDGNGCANTDQVQVTVNPLPTATISGTMDVCQDDTNPTITFTGSNGTAPYTFTYQDAGGVTQTVVSNGAGVATITVPTTNAGTFVYTLVSVQDNSSTMCSNPQSGTATILVNPLPTATISGTTDVCQDDANPTITFTGANGTAPYTFTYTINGGAQQTITTSGVNSVTVNVPTTSAGTFVYELVSVQDNSSTTCSNPQSGTATILVNPLPTATISGTMDVCQDDTDPTITFSGANGTAPYTFTYQDANGVTQTIVSNGAGVATITVPTTAAGTFVYTLVSVQDNSSTTCTNPQSGNVTILVNPLPTATISGTTDVCQDDANPTITFTGANGTAPYTFTYTINGGAQQTITTSGVNSVTVNAPTSTAGTFVYELISVQDNSSTTCSNPQSGTATILVNPLPTATLVGTSDVCLNGSAPTLTFTGSNGTAPYTFNYEDPDGNTHSIVSDNSGVATVHVSTNNAGIFTFTLISVQDNSSTTCSNPQTGTATILVNPLPTATISGTIDVCQNDANPTITFEGMNGTAPYTFTYQDPNGTTQTITSDNSGIATVTQSTTLGGSYSYSLISVQDNSSTTCSNPQSGTVTILVNPLPTATISGTIDVCQDDTDPTITFTGANGTAPYTFTYQDAGGVTQTVVSNGAGVATITAPTTNAGTFVYTLVSVQDNSSTTCANPQSGTATILVNPLPTATISGTIDVCQDDTDPTITFTGANGTAPYTFTYQDAGGVTQTVVSNGAGVATITVPTTNAGTFVYTLVSVQDNSSTMCSNPQSGTATILVNPLPTATISGTVDVCQNGANPAITFTGADGTAPYTFTYTINGGAQQTVSTAGVNSVTVNVPTTSAGTFVYELVSVQDNSSTTCSNPQSGTATIIVNPLPTATISGTTDVCQNDTNPMITFTGANGTAPYTFTYTINGGTQQMVTTTSGNSVTVNAPTTTAGTFIYELISVQDNSSTTCSNPQTGTATILVNPLPTATITGAITVCQEDASPQVTFEGSNGTIPYTFTYTINGGAQQTISTTGTSTTVSVDAPTNVDGVFTYELISVQDNSSTSCLNAQIGSAVVNVKTKPVVSLAVVDNTICSGTNATITPSSVPSGSTFTWTAINNGTTGATNGTGGIIAQNLSVGISQGTAEYEVIGSLGGCISEPVSTTITVNPTPVASASDETICSGEQVNIALNSNVPSTTFTWTHAANGVTGASNGSGNTISQTLQTVTGGTVSYVVTPTLGNCVGSTINVFATVNPLPIVSVQPNQTEICIGDEITLTANGASTYSWSPNAGLSSSNGSAVQASPVVTTNYTVIGIDLNGCSNDAQTSIVVHPYPVLFVSNDMSICFGDQATLTASGADTYVWTPSSTLDNPTNASVTASPSVTTTYQVAGTSNGCTTVESVQVVVNPLPVVNAGADETVCQGSAYTLSGSGAVTYSWDHGVIDGEPFIIDTTATYTVIGTSEFGCKNSDIVTISAVEAPVVAFAADTLEGCAPLHVVFENNTTGAVTYLWNFGDGHTSTAFAPFHDYEMDGCMDVTLTATNADGCATEVTLDNYICVYPNPVASFIPSRYEITNVMNEVDFLNLSQDATSYEWYFGDEDGYSTNEYPHYAYDPTIIRNYLVMLVALNEYGCTDTARVVLEMKPETIIFVPNTFTPDGDAFNNVFKPIIVEGFDTHDYHLSIFNRWGELVFESYDVNAGWDGVYKLTGKICEDGTYVWKIDLKVLGVDNRISETGHVTILR